MRSCVFAIWVGIDTLPTRAELSRDAVAIVAQSGLNATPVIQFLCLVRRSTGLPVVASQMRAVSSCDAVATQRPSGLNAASETMSSCPVRTIDAPVCTFQIRAVLSSDAVTTDRPSGLNLALFTVPV